MQKSVKQIETDPVGWVRSHTGEYNSAKSGHLNDGKTGEVVASGDGKSFSFVRKDAKGKLVDSTPINQETAQEALKSIAFSRYASLPGKFKESVELTNSTRTSKAHEKQADAALSSAGAAWANAKTAAASAAAKDKYWEAMAKKAGQTKTDDMKEAVSAQADLLQKADPKLSRADAELKAANQYLKTPDAKAAVVTAGDVQKFLDSEAAQSKEFLYKTDNRGRKKKRTPEEQQQEAVRLLQLRVSGGSGGAIPLGNANEALLLQGLKNASDEDFRR
jgi:hypothetical protein